VTSTDVRPPHFETSTPLSLAIGGMTCGACAARIERRLNDQNGVSATVNFASERVHIALSEPVAPEVLIHEIESLGFSAQVVDDFQVANQATEADKRVRYLGRRLLVAAILFMPLSDASLAFWFVPRFRFSGWQWVLLAVAAPVLTWAAWPFYSAAIRAARHGTTTMDTLVSLGIASATAWSIYAMFWHDGGRAQLPLLSVLGHQTSGAIYIDVAAGIITFLLAGRYFEALFRRRAGNALLSLARVGAKDAAVLGPDGVESRVPVSQLVVGDEFVVRPGETIATDGDVTAGACAIDRSAMTGESMPADVTSGSAVVGGSICLGGRIVVRATKVGHDTQLAQMIRLVEEAQNEKAAVQRTADRISSIFVPVALAAATLTLFGWLLAGAAGERAFSSALSVLIIACPCALGLATPTALIVASERGAHFGIFFKGYQGLEASRQVDTVVLDKTGTITRGKMVVADVQPVSGMSRPSVLRLAGGVEQASGHLISRAITAAAKAEFGELPPVDQFVEVPGLGARGWVDGSEITVGRGPFLSDSASIPADLAARVASWDGLGRTTVFVGQGNVIIGAVALWDALRPTAAEAVEELRALGLRCILVTGDNDATARAVARQVDVDDVVAAALPSEKVEVIRRLQSDGRSVAMVGDGVNDGPALASADLGIAVGSGTDVAISASDLIVVRDDLRVVATAVELSRRTIGTIHGNFVWAFAYNVAAIPIAACGLLNPLIAGAAMALSSAFVVWNSSRLRHVGAESSPGREEAPSPTAENPPDASPPTEHRVDGSSQPAMSR
jgi:P-type Cu+ transporter